jgi:hypothetical protein
MMGKLMMLAPAAIAALNADGDDDALLLSPSPKEVWTADRLSPVIDIDLGAVQPVDAIFLGSIIGASAGASWTITGGVGGYDQILIQGSAALRVPDAAGQVTAVSHALWTGAAQNLRYIRLDLSQPAGQALLSAGVLMLGKAFSASLGHEWGAGRKVIDTGTATSLPDGGFGVVEGARKGSYSWTFGDLTSAEVDALYALQLDRGETRPLLVIEDPAASAGLRWRLHYGKLVALRQFERRNQVQTRWEITVEDWL